MSVRGVLILTGEVVADALWFLVHTDLPPKPACIAAVYRACLLWDLYWDTRWTALVLEAVGLTERERQFFLEEGEALMRDRSPHTEEYLCEALCTPSVSSSHPRTPETRLRGLR